MTTDHKLIIKDFKTGTGFQASCTCGAKLQRSTGCNASGYWYARQAAEERFADHMTTPTTAPPLLAKTVTARDLSKREWQVLRDAATFSNGYYWSPRTCVKLCDRGLMFRDLQSSGHPYKLTSQGYALLDDTCREAVKAMEVTL